jgi:CBS domain-containing protein
MAQEIDQTRPTLLTMTVGGPRYDVHTLRHYLRVLTQFRNFTLVAFLDADGRFLASMSPWSLMELLEQPGRHLPEWEFFDEQGLADEFVSAINEGEEARLRRYPGVCTKRILTTATNAEVLQQMLEQNLDCIAVIDTEGRLRGVVEREELLSRMVLALVR